MEKVDEAWDGLAEAWDGLAEAWDGLAEAWDGLDKKERTFDVIKEYVEMNNDVESETMRYLGEVWTER